MSSGVHRWEWPSTQTLWQPQDRLKLGPPACITNALLYQLSYPGVTLTRKDLRSWKTVRLYFQTVPTPESGNERMGTWTKVSNVESLYQHSNGT
jgi:hypothetical protein